MENTIIELMGNYQKELCKMWITHCTKPTKTYRSENSYVCKEKVEKLVGTYISRQNFEAAAAELGYVGRSTDHFSRVQNLDYKFTEYRVQTSDNFDHKEAQKLVFAINELSKRIRKIN